MNGEIITLESELDKNMQIYLKSGIYFTMEQLRSTTYRNLIKKIAVCLTSHPDYAEKP